VEGFVAVVKKSAQIRLYCRCGSKLAGRLEPTRVAALTVLAWRSDHTGEGHGAATPVQARAARWKAEREVDE
jgi:hypothetical protein